LRPEEAVRDAVNIFDQLFASASVLNWNLYYSHTWARTNNTQTPLRALRYRRAWQSPS